MVQAINPVRMEAQQTAKLEIVVVPASTITVAIFVMFCHSAQISISASMIILAKMEALQQVFKDPVVAHVLETTLEITVKPYA